MLAPSDGQWPPELQPEPEEMISCPLQQRIPYSGWAFPLQPCAGAHSAISPA